MVIYHWVMEYIMKLENVTENSWNLCFILVKKIMGYGWILNKNHEKVLNFEKNNFEKTFKYFENFEFYFYNKIISY